MTRRIDISWKTIIFITFFILLLWVLFLIRDIILLLFVAFIFMSALRAPVERLVGFGVPRAVSILIIFLLLIAALSSVLTVGFTPIIHETRNLSERLAEIVNYLLRTNIVDQSLIQRELSNASSRLINITLDIFQNFISFVSVIVITFYLLLDRGGIEEKVTSLFTTRKEHVKKLIEEIENKLGSWLRGQLVLSILIGITVYIGLTILGIDFALPLAILAGLLEVVPVIGPIISAIPAVLIGLTVSPLMAGLVAGLYLFIQQLEGHIVVPQVMKKAVGLNPLVVILAISIGGRLLGIAGALLAVPIAVVIEVILQEVLTPAKD